MLFFYQYPYQYQYEYQYPLPPPSESAWSHAMPGSPLLLHTFNVQHSNLNVQVEDWLWLNYVLPKIPNPLFWNWSNSCEGHIVQYKEKRCPKSGGCELWTLMILWPIIIVPIIINSRLIVNWSNSNSPKSLDFCKCVSWDLFIRDF